MVEIKTGSEIPIWPTVFSNRKYLHLSCRLRYVDKIWFADRCWPSEVTDIIKYETRSGVAPKRLPSWKSTTSHTFAAGGRIWRMKFGNLIYTVVKKNAPTLADYNYDPVQSILIIFSKLFANDHKSCLVVKFSISPHICCHYTLWNTMLYFALITLLIARNAPTSITI